MYLLSNFIIKLTKNTTNLCYHEIINILRNNKISYVSKIQIGGEYTYNIDTFDDGRKNIIFLSLNDNIECGLLIIDKETNTAIIQDLLNYPDCLACSNKKKYI